MRYQLQQADLYAFANRQGIETRVRGNELQFKTCPYCHSSRGDRWSFSINMESGAFRCPRASCGRQGHFVELARDFDFQLQTDDTEAFKSLPTVPVTNKRIKKWAMLCHGMRLTLSWYKRGRENNAVSITAGGLVCLCESARH